MPRRLFCARNDDGVRFAVAGNLDEAIEQLGKTARFPMDAEMGEFWDAYGLHGATVSEVARRFGVTSQTASNWRRRAGMPSFMQIRREQRVEESNSKAQEADEAGQAEAPEGEAG